MFGISLSEILLTGIVALVVLGPKQLPQIATKVGLFIYSIRRYITNLKSELYYNSGAHELINTKAELLNTYSTIRNNIKPYNKISDFESNYNYNAPANQLYQPELDFEYQPELFDNMHKE